MRLRILGFLLFLAIAAGTRPATAQTAICRDSTESYSRNRSEACARHGGVARWTPAPRSSSAGRSANRATNPTRRSTSRTAQPTRRASGRRSSASSRVYHTGPRGGCYTYSASGRKRYVDRSLCQ